MANFTGSITINGIADRELVKMLEIKLQHEGQFNFNPQQLQPVTSNIGGKVHNGYNNAFFYWNSESGLAAVYEVIKFLLKKEEYSESSS